MRNKKILHGLMVGIISLGIILAGAFAWVSFTQTALNIFEGWTNPDVNIHDDFDEPNKDVYVENSGKRPLYVRVKFDEFMEIDGSSIMSGGSRGSLDTWPTHTYIGTQGAEICDEETHTYYDWVMGHAAGDPDQGWKYYLTAPQENRALFDEYGMQLRNPLAVEFNDDQKFYGIPNPNYVDPTTTPTEDVYIFVTLKEAYAYIDDVLAENISAATTFTTPEFVSNTEPVSPIAQFAGSTNLDYLNWLYSVIDLDSSKITNVASRERAVRDAAAAATALNNFLEAAGIGYYQTSYEVISKADKTGMETDKYTHLELENIKDATGTMTQIEYLFSQGYLKKNSTMTFEPLARTNTTAKVYTMAQWLAAGMPVGDFWVMDDDGWCYWADVLLPGQTTGLLLSEVILDELNPPAGVWWYGINVSLQAVTAEDIVKLGIESGNPAEVGGGYTQQGEMLLDAISGKYVYGVDKSSGTVDGAGAQLIPTATIYTYEKFKDNTYRMRNSEGQAQTYAPLFIYTGSTGSNVAAMTSLYDAFKPGTTYSDPANHSNNFVDNSEYKVGTEFWKLAEVNPETWVKFTVVNAEQGSYESGVIQAANGKRYVMLGYDYDTGDKTDPTSYDKTAWLAVGGNGVFDSLITTQPSGVTIPSYQTNDKVSNNDDLLIWTAEKEPGIEDRYSETEAAKSLKIGDTIEIDSIEWLVIGKKAGTEPDGSKDETLLISKDVLEDIAYGTDGDGVTTALATYANGSGVGKTKLNALTGGDITNVKAILLTPKEAIDYFSSNETRAALMTGGTTNSAWWLGEASGAVVPDSASDGGSVVAANGGFEAYEDEPDTSDAYGLRPAIWVNSKALYDHYETLNP